MRYVYMLLGVRGAGKTSILNELDQDDRYQVLNTVTTRKKRGSGDSFYNFIDDIEWESLQLAYELEAGSTKYGMEVSELYTFNKDKIGVTVFHPLFSEMIEDIRQEHNNIKFITIGLDTIETLEEQKKRVGYDESRYDSHAGFEKQRKYIVEECNFIFKGDLESIIRQISNI